MPVTEIGDPRLQALFGASNPRELGIRPVVRLPSKGLPPIALAAIALVLGLLLFLVLNERRTSESEPAVRLRPDLESSAWASPPPLNLPPVSAPVVAPPTVVEQQPAVKPLLAPSPLAAPRPVPVQTVYLPQPAPPIAPPAQVQQPRVSAGPPLVIDTTSAPSSGSMGVGAIAGLARSGEAVTRMRASALANRSTTIVQGTMIQAVLETGFDSTEPGFARAVVSRDVRSFDGTNVLIPRGSKLIGEYKSDVAQGQKRAVIVWTRLIRPDGMTITMDSPAVDTVGRGGVSASVNNHFFAKLGDALLQTTVGIGSALAERSVSPVVVLSGTTTMSGGQLSPTTNYVPTLTVPAGKSISVFVAHDLDFGSGGTPR